MNHLWQSTVFAGAAAMSVLALRSHRAETRFWVWMAASLKFLLPFSWLIALGEFAGSRLGWSRAVVRQDVPLLLAPISEPVARIHLASAQAVALQAIGLPEIFFAIWICGALAVVASWSVKWRRMRRMVREASPADFGLAVETRVTSERIEPGVVGIFRPVLMLPEKIRDRLTPAQLQAIFAHEMCHLRRRDNFFAFVHMVVEAIFWFHPLAWWIGARLVEERERACDEEVLGLGNEPRSYAQGILRVCELCLESRIACVAGVSGSNLRKRIEGIMSSRIGFRLTFAGKFVLGTGAVAAVTVPIAVGMLVAPAVHAQSAPADSKSPFAFDVASIKPSPPRGRGGIIHQPPGGKSYEVAGAPLSMIMTVAYSVTSRQISGGPGWIKTDRWNIEAKAERSGTSDELHDALARLLEDRFKLRVRREAREMPCYILTVDKKGSKMPVRDPADLLHEPFSGARGPGGVPVFSAKNATMNYFAFFLSRILDLNVIDHTSLPDHYDVDFDFVPDRPAIRGNEPPGAEPPPLPDGPDIFTALREQLGLRLEKGKGPVEFLVIEHVEKPSEN